MPSAPEQRPLLAAQAKQIRSLQADLSTVTTTNQALTARVAGMSDLAKPKSFAGQLHVIYNCIPQLEAQVNGINLAGVDSGFPYIQNDTQVSGDCSTLIYGSQTTP